MLQVCLEDRSCVKYSYHTSHHYHHHLGDRDKLWEVMDIFMVVMIPMLPWVYTYPQINQAAHTKYAQLFTCEKI